MFQYSLGGAIVPNAITYGQDSMYSVWFYMLNTVTDFNGWLCTVWFVENY